MKQNRLIHAVASCWTVGGIYVAFVGTNKWALFAFSTSLVVCALIAIARMSAADAKVAYFRTEVDKGDVALEAARKATAEAWRSAHTWRSEADAHVATIERLRLELAQKREHLRALRRRLNGHKPAKSRRPSKKF